MKKLLETAAIILFFSVMITVCIQSNNRFQLENKDKVADIQIESENTQISVVIKDKQDSKESIETSTEESFMEETVTDEITTEEVTTEIILEQDLLTEDEIYSFYQTSHAWWQGKTWSGEWSTWEYAGRSFSDFGCGLCCIANIYDTLSPYEVSPWTMFQFAQNVSGYSPSSAGAAIGWRDMKTTLNSCGIACELYNKPSSYEAFRQQISQCTSAIVLVSSANDNTYWSTTYGHYVSIWLYEEETDTVFLSDSGKYGRNRQRVPLRYVYNALKTASNYQYLTVTEYIEEYNKWKGNGITEQWNRP